MCRMALFLGGHCAPCVVDQIWPLRSRKELIELLHGALALMVLARGMEATATQSLRCVVFHAPGPVQQLSSL